MKARLAAVALLGAVACGRHPPSADAERAAREKMVRTQIAKRGVKDPRVLRAMGMPRAISSSIPPSGTTPTPIGPFRIGKAR
jgi:hypothetical protein